MSQRILILVIICFTSVVFSPFTLAKKRCKPLLEKLHKVQALQRSSYSQKKGVSLRKREDKARDRWWQCENSSAKSQKKVKKKSKGKAKRKRSNHKTSAQNKHVNSKVKKAPSPFKTTKAIVLKSRYQGDKQQAWLAFYQQPSHCRRPKSLVEFAFCSENKQKQRVDFEKHYTK